MSDPEICIYLEIIELFFHRVLYISPEIAYHKSGFVVIIKTAQPCEIVKDSANLDIYQNTTLFWRCHVFGHSVKLSKTVTKCQRIYMTADNVKSWGAWHAACI